MRSRCSQTRTLSSFCWATSGAVSISLLSASINASAMARDVIAFTFSSRSTSTLIALKNISASFIDCYPTSLVFLLICPSVGLARQVEIVDFHHRAASNPLDQRIEIARTDLMRFAQVHQLADLALDIGLLFQPKLALDLGV